jgi:hypothetical protein
MADRLMIDMLYHSSQKEQRCDYYMYLNAQQTVKDAMNSSNLCGKDLFIYYKPCTRVTKGSNCGREKLSL